MSRSRLVRSLKASLVMLAAAASLTATVAGALSADDDIPGVPMPASPVSGSLVTTQNPYAVNLTDVYSIRIGFNDRLDAVLAVPSSGDFDLYLFAPGATRVATALQPPFSQLVMYSGDQRNGYDEAFTFVSDRSTTATYYVGAKTWSGSGNYRLTWAKRKLPAPSVTTTAPLVVPYGGTARIRASVATTPSAWPIANLSASVIANPFGEPAWSKAADATSTATGVLTFNVKPTRQTRYRVKTRWATHPTLGSIGWGYGPIVTVTPRAYLSIARAPEEVARGRSFGVSGYLKPGHATPGSGHVTVGAWKRLPNKTWAYHRSFSARHSGTAWSASVALPTSGTWLVRAAVAPDELHAYTQSYSRFVTVR